MITPVLYSMFAPLPPPMPGTPDMREQINDSIDAIKQSTAPPPPPEGKTEEDLSTERDGHFVQAGMEIADAAKAETEGDTVGEVAHSGQGATELVKGIDANRQKHHDYCNN